MTHTAVEKKVIIAVNLRKSGSGEGGGSGWCVCVCVGGGGGVGGVGGGGGGVVRVPTHYWLLTIINKGEAAPIRRTHF